MKDWIFLNQRDGQWVSDQHTTVYVEDDGTIAMRTIRAEELLVDAVAGARGPFLCQLQHRREQEFSVLWQCNASEILREFQRWCALSFVDLLDPSSILVEYLKTGNESLKDEARDEASEAYRAACKKDRNDLAFSVKCVARSIGTGQPWTTAGLIMQWARRYAAREDDTIFSDDGNRTRMEEEREKQERKIMKIVAKEIDSMRTRRYTAIVRTSALTTKKFTYPKRLTSFGIVPFVSGVPDTKESDIHVLFNEERTEIAATSGDRELLEELINFLKAIGVVSLIWKSSVDSLIWQSTEENVE